MSNNWDLYKDKRTRSASKSSNGLFPLPGAAQGRVLLASVTPSPSLSHQQWFQMQLHYHMATSGCSSQLYVVRIH